MIAKSGSKEAIRLRAIVIRKNAITSDEAWSLLRRDLHGSFDGTMLLTMTVMSSQTDSASRSFMREPFRSGLHRIRHRNALVVDNTGKWRDREGLTQHLKSNGASRVLLTAPGKGDLRNIVHGVNHDEITDADAIVSAASCTTNAITPVLAAIDEKYGVQNGHVETVHSYTNDQNLIDNFHPGDRRANATLNMVITETGAAKAVAKALPQLTN